MTCLMPKCEACQRSFFLIEKKKKKKDLLTSNLCCLTGLFHYDSASFKFNYLSEMVPRTQTCTSVCENLTGIM